MTERTLGRTGLEVSALSFGCGAVGGLMVRGTPMDQERAVARAIDLGIRYFDTAPQYGDGASESNLGRILATLRAHVLVGTKVRIREGEHGRIGESVVQSLDQSLRRLGRDSVDLYQLHNRIAARSDGDALSVETVLAEVVPAFERLRHGGKARHFGFTALGETAALHRLVDAGVLETAQVCFNALNFSADVSHGDTFDGQDYGLILQRMASRGMGSIGIRVLAGGALSGSEARHPTAMQSVAPIGSGPSYAADVARARLLEPLVREGAATSLVELALRFAISGARPSTILIGMATPDEFETAAAAVAKGPLPPDVLARIREIVAPQSRG